MHKMCNRISGLRATSLLAAALIPLTFSGTALAQVASESPDEAEAEGTRDNDIIVTAQRRSERLQDVPVAISAFTNEQLENSGVFDTRDLQVVTPGLNFVQAAYAPQPTIRGIGTRSPNPGDEQVVPTYIDGVYQSFTVGGIFELSNVERIEVLRGPQGTLLGRNAIGGAINIITRDPEVDPAMELSIGYGSFNEVRGAAYLTGGSGPIAASLSMNYVNDDGYVREVNTGTQLSDIDSFLIRGKILIKPTDRTSIGLTAMYSSREDNAGATTLAIGGNTIARRLNPDVLLPTAKREVSLSLLPFSNVGQKAISATIAHDFGGAELTSISGYSNSTIDVLADLDATASNVAFLQIDQYDKGFTQELFLVSTGNGPFSWIVGGFYMDNKAGFNSRQVNTSITRSNIETEAYAFYAQGSLQVSDAVKLTVGGRYSHDEKCADATGNAGQFLLQTCKSWESFDPSATLDVKLTSSTMIYARYAQAYKAGVFNETSFSPIPVNPEGVKSYELGLKSDPLDWLRLNIAGFYTSYSDLQVNTRDPVTLTVVLQNAAQARIYGMDAELVFKLAPKLNLRAGFSYIDAKYSKFPEAQELFPRPQNDGGNVQAFIDASGFKLPRTPDFAASLAVDYSVPAFGGNLNFSGNIYYQGGFNWTLSGRINQPDYAIVNSRISWSTNDDRFELTLWARNLTNQQPLLTASISTLSDAGMPGRPRSVGVTLSGKF